ncbi:DEAD/DEAH box helicase [Phaeacidiphilus oryzae]|uniref:DEAD/DEAH box helicase n=1 Tax=Phaeacidiphilus oryzae TaxID=348818 RepID=UPI0005654E62|nr:DEAD/DEAH box helicase [Phaeacidiphilus oryzae]
MSMVDDGRITLPENGEAELAATGAEPIELARITEIAEITESADKAHQADHAESAQQSTEIAENDTDTDVHTETGVAADEDAAEAPEAAAPAEPTFGDLGLPDDIVRALQKRGVSTPFPIQAATIPDALAGRDVLGRGRTGSGKTLSFGLPLLTRLAEGRTKPKRPRGLILTPTRELAMQVSDALEPYGSVLGLNLKVVCGGTSMPRQIYALERGVDVLVATPGRLRDLIDRGAAVLDEVEVAVLDEADQMADMGFLPEVTEILDLVPAGGQRMLFSATLENEIDTLVKRYLNKPVTHEVDPSAGAVTTMTHHILVVKPKDKAPVTNAIAARKGRTIIFVRTQLGADRVADQLRDAGIKADALHGGMTQGARTRTLADFKDGYVNALVATDVAARGIHVDDIDLVLNVDPAGDHKDYLHRSGRTARAGRSGTVVTLALPHQRRGIFRLMEDAGVDASRHIVGNAFDADVARITGARSLSEIQAESAASAAQQAEQDVVRLQRDLEKLQRRAVELREEADRLSARAARDRAEMGIEDEADTGASTAEQVEGQGQVEASTGPVAAAAAAPAGSAEAVEGSAPEASRGERPESAGQSVREMRGQSRTFDRDRDRDRDRRDDRRDDRGGRSFDRDRSFNREDRGGRSFDRRDDRGGRSFDRRDDRRDDRGGRPFDRDRSYNREDRGGRSFDRRDDRGGRSFDRRDDRRDDRGGRSFDRDRSFNREDRGGRSFDRRDDRGGRPFDRDRSYNRDDRGGRSFDRRDDRPARPHSQSRPYGGDRERGARPAFGDRDRSSNRPYGRRDDRGGRGFERRDDRGPRGFDRPDGDRKPRWKRNG